MRTRTVGNNCLSPPDPNEERSVGGLALATSIESHARWLIKLRWCAAVVAGIFVVVATRFFDWLPREAALPLATAVGVLAVSNLVFLLLVRKWPTAITTLQLQMCADLGIFVVLLHFSGGIENPLWMLLVLHIILAGIVFSRRQCFAIAVWACLLFALLLVGEWTGVLRHYSLRAHPHFAPVTEDFHAAKHGLFVTGSLLLETLVLFLTAYFVSALAERQRQSQRQLLRAAQLAAVGELAGQVAHEVNNPIGVISAKARLLLSDHREEMSARVAADLVKIVSLSDRVARIAQGLLSSSRPSRAARATIDLRLPIRKALSLIEDRAKRQNVLLQDQLPAQPQWVHAAEPDLDQIFLNLFLNALDAMPDGGSLRLYLRPSNRKHNHCVEVVTEDSGKGIDPAIRTKILEPFFTTKPLGRGTGLGLSICAGLAERQGGRIRLDTSDREGSRFILSLPATPVNQRR